jgi:GH35 family endo-1,4-beta-xylanase
VAGELKTALASHGIVFGSYIGLPMSIGTNNWWWSRTTAQERSAIEAAQLAEGSIAPSLPAWPIFLTPAPGTTGWDLLNITRVAPANQWPNPTYVWDPLDDVVAFHTGRGMQVGFASPIYNNINVTPNWVKVLPRADRLAFGEALLRATILRYASNPLFKMIEVTNELLDTLGNPNAVFHSLYEEVDYAFQVAHQARIDAGRPDIKLLMAEYSAEAVNTRSNVLYLTVDGMIDRGIPIDGVAFQGHMWASAVDAASIKTNLDRFAALGLEIHVSELDDQTLAMYTDGDGYNWNTPSPPIPQANLDAQGERFYQFTMAVMRVGSEVKRISPWILSDIEDGRDDPVWMPNGHLLDYELDRKPAYDRMLEASTVLSSGATPVIGGATTLSGHMELGTTVSVSVLGS